MTTTIIALYDNADQAQKVINELGKSGYKKEDIELVKADGQAGDAIAGKLTSRGISRREAGTISEAIRRGAALIVLDTGDEKADAALELLNRHGAKNFENLESELNLGGQRPQGKEEGRETVPVIEEEVSVGKRRVLRGGLRVTSTVTEKPVEETVKLREEKVEVERHHADRKLSPEEADKAFQEKSVQMTETAEEVAVSKEARVVEEVALRKTAEEHEQTVHETARRTDVKVEEIEPKTRPEGKR